jgi:hypothetical protein
LVLVSIFIITQVGCNALDIIGLGKVFASPYPGLVMRVNLPDLPYSSSLSMAQSSNTSLSNVLMACIILSGLTVSLKNFKDRIPESSCLIFNFNTFFFVFSMD